MFLDDELYEWVKLKDLEKVDDFATLVNELYAICDQHKEKHLKKEPNMLYSDFRRLMDGIFISWNAMIAKLEKEDWYLIDTLKLCSYKDAFMNNPTCKSAYERGLKK